MSDFEQRIDGISDAIREEEIAKFDMSETIADKSCGTAACIYGFAILKEFGPGMTVDEIDRNPTIPTMYSENWQEYFQLPSYKISELFLAYSLEYPTQCDHVLDYLTKDDGLKVLQDVRNGTFSTWTESLGPERVQEISDTIDRDLS